MITAKYLIECIGTFFLVFTAGMALGPLAPFAIAAVLVAFIYAGGHISGGHYNPAITLGVWLRGALPKPNLVPYMVAQFLGGLVAAGLYLFILQPSAVELSVMPMHPILLVEFLFTFALVFVALNTATVKTTMPNSYFGLAIGLTVLAGALTVGGISGAVFNPVVAVALVVMKKLSWQSLWIYLVAQCAGGAAAGYAFSYVNKDDTPKL